MGKVIILDFGHFIHNAAYSKSDMYPPYSAMVSMISCLKRVKVNKDDLIIIAVDGRKSWRKDFETAYKANRKALRDKSGKDWTKIFSDFDKFLHKLDVSTKWNIIKIDRLEADDIMAVACRYYKNNEVILITTDSDLHQMWIYPNVKIYSPHPKVKNFKFPPKNFNVYKFIRQKIKKEASDNLISPVVTEEDYTNRNICVNLLQLPEWVEEIIIKSFENIKEKEENLFLFPFPKLVERFTTMCIKNKQIGEETVGNVRKKIIQQTLY